MKQEPDLMKSIEDAERLRDLLKIGVSFFDAFQLVYNRNCDEEEGKIIVGIIQDEVFSEIAPDVNYSQKQNS